MRKIIKTLATISLLLLSIAFFLYVYQSLGFVFTIYCLYGWGLAIAYYAFILWLISFILEEEYF